jgi:hypothetical protein
MISWSIRRWTARHRAWRRRRADIDGVVSVIDGAALAVGEFARVTVTASDQHDLVARRAQ